MKTAKENIASLPEYCYAVLLMDRSVMIVHAGEGGYQKLLPSFSHSTNEQAFEAAMRLNEKLGVTRQQMEAMMWGSQFGYGHRLADPESYDAQGKPIRSQELELA